MCYTDKIDLMNKQKQLAKLIISGRYQRTSSDSYSRESSHYGTIENNQLRDTKINKIIQDKYRTFTKWNLRKSLPLSRRSPSHLSAEKSNKQLSNNSSIKINFSIKADKKNQNKNEAVGIRPIVQKKVKGDLQQKNYFSSRQNNKNSSQLTSRTKITDTTTKVLSRNISPKPPSRVQNPQKTKQKKAINKQKQSVEQLAVRSDRRQRFKKLQNPVLLIKHYIMKQNYSPSAEQKELIDKLVSLQKILDQQQPDLQHILAKIYRLMNLAVDYNQLKFLALIILLAADVCFYLKDLSRAFYFYNQTRIAGSYAHLDNLKISSLIGLAKIAFNLQDYQASTRIFRKTLQYAWKANDEDTQLEVYDWLGQTLHFEGRVRDSFYYHARYSHNQLEQNNSALKKISKQMLNEYDRYIFSLEDSNLDSLFIEYLNLPINKQFQGGKSTKKNFGNLKNGESPRMSKNKSKMDHNYFQDVRIQLDSFLSQDYEFRTQISNPDTHQNFKQVKRFGKIKNQIDFEHSLQFNKIVGFRKQRINLDNALKLPLEAQVQKKLKQRLDPQWWQKMVGQTRKRRSQKVGALKQRVRNSHMSYHKYPHQRKKNSLWSTDQINQSINRTLLDWIDPPVSASNSNKDSNNNK